MKNTNIVTYIFKGILLLILDIITFLFVFSVWTIVNIPLFPWAFCAIIFSLIVANVLVLTTPKCIRLFGVGAYVSTLISTFLYYVFVMIYTGFTYISISPKWYLISILFVTLIYIAVLSGLYRSGINKNEDVVKQEIEQAMVADVTLQLMTIGENIKSCCDLVDKASYVAIIEAFDNMSERLKASTPFGRTMKPVVVNFESQIILKLTTINNDIVLLKTNEDQKSCKSISETLTDVKSLIINREKLILQ